jgi:hypothetical protein
MKTLANDNDVREIRGRMESLTADDRAVWGLMSVAEMVCHVREAFALGLGEWTAAPVKGPLPAPVLKRLALWMPMQWPHSVPTVSELKKENAPSPKVFAEDLLTALAAMEKFVAAKDNRTKHAIFGSMTPTDWMRWGYLHTDHHLRQFGR